MTSATRRTSLRTDPVRRSPCINRISLAGRFGGPVLRNRTFFFGSYQGTRIRRGQSYISTVPSRDIVKRGDFSKQPAVRRNIYDPSTLTGTGANAVRQQFAGNIIPRERWDPVAARIIQMYPASNIPGRDDLPDNYFYSPSDSDTGDQYDFRGDHNFTSNPRFFARYSRWDQFRNEPGPLPYPAMGGLGQTVDLMGHNVVGNLSNTFGPTLFNGASLRVFEIRYKVRYSFTENMNQELGIKNAPGDSTMAAITGLRGSRRRALLRWARAASGRTTTISPTT
jgi:hypothetical protein